MNRQYWHIREQLSGRERSGTQSFSVGFCFFSKARVLQILGINMRDCLIDGSLRWNDLATCQQLTLDGSALSEFFYRSIFSVMSGCSIYNCVSLFSHGWTSGFLSAIAVFFLGAPHDDNWRWMAALLVTALVRSGALIRSIRIILGESCYVSQCKAEEV